RTSSERMLTTSSPAKATAAIVALAYSAVAAPDSSVNSRAERRRVRRGTVMGLSLSVGGHGLGEAGTGSGSEGQGRAREHADHQRRHAEQQEGGQCAHAQRQEQPRA